MEKANCWKVKVHAAALLDLIKQLGKEDVAWMWKSDGDLKAVVVLCPNPVTKKYAVRKMKAAVDVHPMNYEVFKAYKPGCRQIKYHSLERSAQLKEYFTSLTKA